MLAVGFGNVIDKNCEEANREGSKCKRRIEEFGWLASETRIGRLVEAVEDIVRYCLHSN
jgi:hypothetical protein